MDEQKQGQCHRRVYKSNSSWDGEILLSLLVQLGLTFIKLEKKEQFWGKVQVKNLHLYSAADKVRNTNNLSNLFRFKNAVKYKAEVQYVGLEVILHFRSSVI